jgi:hypothetical protein
VLCTTLKVEVEKKPPTAAAAIPISGGLLVLGLILILALAGERRK